MIALTRREAEGVMIGDDVELTVTVIGSDAALFELDAGSGTSRHKLKVGEGLTIEQDLFVRLVQVNGDRVRRVFDGPTQAKIRRKELWKIKQ